MQTSSKWRISTLLCITNTQGMDIMFTNAIILCIGHRRSNGVTDIQCYKYTLHLNKRYNQYNQQIQKIQKTKDTINTIKRYNQYNQSRYNTIEILKKQQAISIGDDTSDAQISLPVLLPWVNDYRPRFVEIRAYQSPAPSGRLQAQHFNPVIPCIGPVEILVDPVVCEAIRDAHVI